jgi:hypothetical protein
MNIYKFWLSIKNVIKFIFSTKKWNWINVFFDWYEDLSRSKLINVPLIIWFPIIIIQIITILLFVIGLIPFYYIFIYIFRKKIYPFIIFISIIMFIVIFFISDSPDANIMQKEVINYFIKLIN